MSVLLSGLSRNRPLTRLVPVNGPWKHPVRCMGLLGEKTVPLAFDKIETRNTKTHNVQIDHPHTGAIVLVHGLL